MLKCGTTRRHMADMTLEHGRIEIAKKRGHLYVQRKLIQRDRMEILIIILINVHKDGFHTRVVALNWKIKVNHSTMLKLIVVRIRIRNGLATL